MYRLLLLFAIAFAADAADRQFWVSGYYVNPSAWKHTYQMAPTDIDFSTVTHVLHFAARPNPDGSLDLTHYGLSASAPAVVKAAHAANRKVLMTIGRSNSAPGFRGATAKPNMAKFVSSIVETVARGHYDGVDIDWEPLEQRDAARFAEFVTALKAGLNSLAIPQLLTAAVPVRAFSVVAPIHAHFDQINLMTYDMSWPGARTTWHNSALFAGGLRDRKWRAALPSIEAHVAAWLRAGVPAGRLSIGIPFYGYIWNGASGPAEPYRSTSTIQPIDYSELLTTIYEPAFEQWDSIARVPFLSLIKPDGERAFVSFDNEASVSEKVRYAISLKLGGVMIWELCHGYFGDRAPGQRNPLLTAIRNAIHSRE